MSESEGRNPVCTGINGVMLEIAISPRTGALAPGTQETLCHALRATDEIVGPLQGEVGVLVETDEKLRDLNRIWRGIDRPTNVLSFPAPRLPASGPKHLGDVAVSYETALREAKAENKPLGHHLAHLAVHGFLHLVGYDHQSDHAADVMEQLERRILARLDMPDPYAC